MDRLQCSGTEASASHSEGGRSASSSGRGSETDAPVAADCIRALDHVAPGQGIELPNRQADQDDEDRGNDESGLLHWGALGRSHSGPTTRMSGQGPRADIADTTLVGGVSRANSTKRR